MLRKAVPVRRALMENRPDLAAPPAPNRNPPHRVDGPSRAMQPQDVENRLRFVKKLVIVYRIASQVVQSLIRISRAGIFYAPIFALS